MRKNAHGAMHNALWRGALPTAIESPLVYACELRVFAMCPALRGSTVSYAGVAHFPKHSLEYSLNLWSQSKKKKNARGAMHSARVSPRVTEDDSLGQQVQSLSGAHLAKRPRLLP